MPTHVLALYFFGAKACDKPYRHLGCRRKYCAGMSQMHAHIRRVFPKKRLLQRRLTEARCCAGIALPRLGRGAISRRPTTVAAVRIDPYSERLGRIGGSRGNDEACNEESDSSSVGFSLFHVGPLVGADGIEFRGYKISCYHKALLGLNQNEKKWQHV